jgi:hypothetical protein
MKKALFVLLAAVTLMAGCAGCSEPFLQGGGGGSQTLSEKIAGTTWNCTKCCNLSARKEVSSVIFQETGEVGVLSILLKSEKDGKGDMVESLRLDENEGTCVVSRNGSASGNSLVEKDGGMTLTLCGIEAMELEKLP